MWKSETVGSGWAQPLVSGWQESGPRLPGWVGAAQGHHAHGDLTSLAPHERLPEILVVPREKTPTGAAARGNP